MLARKYVDDFLIIGKKNDMSSIHSTLNSFNQNIQFTFEKETNNELPYLDMLLIRKDNKIITSIYRKPTSRGRILNFLSSHPSHLKINTAKGLIRRTFKLTTKELWKENEFPLIKTLKENNYPTSIIKKWITDEKRRLEMPSINESSLISSDIQYKALTYVKGLSERLEKTIRQNCPNTRIAFRSRNTCNQQLFSKLKDKVPKYEKCNVVYKIDCKDCEKCYVGMTKQKLKHRINQHKNDIKKNYEEKTALSAHAVSLNHTINFDDVRIVEVESNLLKRSILEMIHIKKQGNLSVNYRTDVQNLNQIYCNLI